MKYQIKNANGLQGRAWDIAYGSKGSAAVAIAHAFGWSEVYLSAPYTAGSRDQQAYSAYASEAARDADNDGAQAPRVVVIR